MSAFRKALVLTAIIVTAAPICARAGDRLGLNLAFTAESFTLPLAKSVSFGPNIDLIYTHRLSPDLEARVDLGAEFVTGAISGQLPADILGQNGPRQDLRMREAVLDFGPWDRALDLQAGAINQGFVNNPLLFGDFALLGAREDVAWARGPARLAFGLEEAIPPSSFSLLDSAASAKTPGFYLAHFDGTFGDKLNSFISFDLGAFAFEDLTPAQARQSLYAGNSVVGNLNSAAFYLPYRGFEGALGGGLALAPRWQLVLVANAVHNASAPAGSNAGYLGQTRLSYRRELSTLSGEFGYFNDQSDSAPALFADSFLNAKNHRGIFVGARYDDAASAYAVFSRWKHSDALVPGLYGGKDDTVVAGLEIRYELRR